MDQTKRSRGCVLDIRFRETYEGGKSVGYVTIVLPGKQVVQSFTPAYQGMAFIEAYVATIRKAAERQAVGKLISHGGLQGAEKDCKGGIIL